MTAAVQQSKTKMQIGCKVRGLVSRFLTVLIPEPHRARKEGWNTRTKVIQSVMGNVFCKVCESGSSTESEKRKRSERVATMSASRLWSSYPWIE